MQRIFAVLLAVALTTCTVSNAAPASVLAQSDTIASGTDWVLEADGRLTIRSDAGMSDWATNGRGKSYNYNGEIKSGDKWVTSAEIQNGVTFIADSAFMWSENLLEITIPEGVESIGDSTFYGCSNLKSITIPQSITSIGDSVFGDCTSLQRVTICSDIPPACGFGIFYYSDNAKVYVPVCNYLTASGWIQYKSKIFPERHTGDISYSASGSKITQKCGTCKTVYGTATLSSSGTNFTYTGNAITPVSVTYADFGTNTWMGEKPTAITYADNINAGPATASLTFGTGETAATAMLSFTIQPKALTDGMVTLSADLFPYTGNAITPEVTVQDGGMTLTKDTDYTVSYTNNSAVGTAAVTVTGKGNYSGEVTRQFQIVESDAGKMAVAKSVVENALAGITATNATTDTEILDVINTALSKAGITDVTVTITADAPAGGKQFDRWQVGRGGVTLADSMSSTTTFTMPERDVEVEAAYKDITEEHTYNYGNWQHDDTQHWKVCSCGAETGREIHDFGEWFTDKEATAAEAGTRRRECQTCGYRQTETIPATGTEPESGTITSEVNSGANAPAANISTSAEELKDMLLTEEEKQQVQNGINTRIVLEIQDAENTVSASDRAAVAQALNGFAVGQYLDIDLYKLVGADRTDITETEKKIRIVIIVPDSLKNADSSKTRTFAVIRVHDDRAEFLMDFDNDADTVTIETDRFSTYALVYKDAAVDTGSMDNEEGSGAKTDSEKGHCPCRNRCLACVLPQYRQKGVRAAGIFVLRKAQESISCALKNT